MQFVCTKSDDGTQLLNHTADLLKVSRRLSHIRLYSGTLMRIPPVELVDVLEHNPTVIEFHLNELTWDLEQMERNELIKRVVRYCTRNRHNSEQKRGTLKGLLTSGGSSRVGSLSSDGFYWDK